MSHMLLDAIFHTGQSLKYEMVVAWNSAHHKEAKLEELRSDADLFVLGLLVLCQQHHL